MKNRLHIRFDLYKIDVHYSNCFANYACRKIDFKVTKFIRKFLPSQMKINILNA